MSKAVYTDEEIKKTLQQLFLEKKRVKELQKKLQEIGQERNLLREELASLQAAKIASQATIPIHDPALEEKIRRLQEKVVRSVKTSQELQAHLEEEKARSKMREDELNTAIGDLENRIATLTRSIQDKDTQVSHLQEDLHSAQNHIPAELTSEEEREKVLNLQDTNERLKKALRALKDKYDSEKFSFEENTKDEKLLSALKKGFKQSNERVKQLEHSYENLQEEKKRLEKLLQEQVTDDGELVDVQKQLLQTQEALTLLQQQKVDIQQVDENALHTLKESYAILQKERDQLSENFEHARKKQETLFGQLKHAALEIEELQEQVAHPDETQEFRDMKRQYTIASRTVIAQDAKCKELSAQLEVYKAEIDAYNEQLNDASEATASCLDDLKTRCRILETEKEALEEAQLIAKSATREEQEHIQQLKSSNEDLLKQLQKSAEEIRNLQSDHSQQRLNESYENLKSDNTKLETLNKNLTRSLEQSKEEQDSLNDILIQSQEELNSLVKEYDRLRRDKQRLEDERDHLQNLTRKLQETNQDLEKAKAKAEIELELTVHRASNAFECESEANNNFSSLSSAHAKLQVKFRTLEDQLSRVENDLKNSIQNKTELESQLLQSQEGLKSTFHQYDQLKTTHKNTQIAYDDLVASSKRENEELKQRLEETERSEEILLRQFQQGENRIQSLEERIQQQEKENTVYLTKHGRLEDVIQEGQDSLLSLKENLIQAKEDAAEYKASLDCLSEANQALQNEQNALQLEIDEKTRVIGTLSEHLSEKTVNLESSLESQQELQIKAEQQERDLQLLNDSHEAIKTALQEAQTSLQDSFNEMEVMRHDLNLAQDSCQDYELINSNLKAQELENFHKTEELRQALITANADLNHEQKRLRELEDDLHSVKLAYENSSQETQDLKERLQLSEGQFEELTSAKGGLDEDIEKVTTALHDSQLTNHTLQKQQEALQHKVSLQQQQLSQVLAKTEAQQKDLNGLKDIEYAYSKIREQRDKLEQLVKQSHHHLQKLQGENKGLNEKLTEAQELKVDLEQRTQEVKELREELEQSEQSIISLTTELNKERKVTESFEVLKNQESQARSTISSLEQKLQQQQDKFNSEHENRLAGDHEIQKLQMEGAQHKEQLQSRHEKLEDLSKDIHVLKQALVKSVGEHKALEEQYYAVMNEKVATHAKCHQLKQGLENQTQNVKQLSDQLKRRQLDEKEMKQNLDQLQTLTASQEKEIESLHTKVSSLLHDQSEHLDKIDIKEAQFTQLHEQYEHLQVQEEEIRSKHKDLLTQTQQLSNQLKSVQESEKLYRTDAELYKPLFVEHQQLVEEASTLRSDLATREQELQESSSMQQQLERSFVEQATSLEQQQQQIAEQTAKLTALLNENKKKQGFIEQLEHGFTEKESQVKTMQIHLAKKVRESTELRDAIDKQHIETNKYQSELQNMHNQMKEAKHKLHLQQLHEQKMQDLAAEQAEAARTQTKEWESKYFAMQDKFQNSIAENRELKKMELEYQQMQQLLGNIKNFMSAPMGVPHQPNTPPTQQQRVELPSQVAAHTFEKTPAEPKEKQELFQFAQTHTQKQSPKASLFD